jgi:hypothetical protein
VNGSAHGHNTREAIEKFAETLEKDLLAQFDTSYRKQDFEGMRVSTVPGIFAGPC